MSVDASQLERYLDLLTTADAQIDRETARALKRVTDTLKEYARGIEHVKTGAMRDSTYSLGPFAAGGGILESTIASAAPHTIYEINRGGDHDWMDRTIIEQSGVLDALADECGRIVAAAVTEG